MNTDNTKKRKRIYIIEAPDGGGKDTLLANLQADLPQSLQSLPLQVFREPGGSEVGEAGRRILKGAVLKHHPMSILEEASYVWAGRFALWRQIVEWFKGEGKENGIIFLNRSYPSSFAYQAYTRSAAEFIRQICIEGEKEVMRMIAMEDASIEIRQLFLEVSFSTAKKRITGRPAGGQDIDRFDVLLPSVIAGYKRYYEELAAGTHAHFGLIHTADILDAERDPASVLAQAQTVILGHDTPALVTT